MLRSMKDFQDCSIGASDGPIGLVKDLYFDDDAWVVRYLVVDTGLWLASRKVLISPMSIEHPKWADHLLPVSISKEQVRNGPDIDTEMPVSRQHEAQTYAACAERERQRNDDPHLRSGEAVVGHHLQATDGDIGQVEGLLIDDETWAIRYLVVDTSNWWGGHQVLIAPQWITGVRWSDRSVTVDLTRESVKAAPPYVSTAELNRQRETGLYEHHGRKGYWARDVLETEV